jgi:hypothetical protein
MQYTYRVPVHHPATPVASEPTILSTHQTPYRCNLAMSLTYTGFKKNTATEIRKTMTSHSLPHLSDMVLRTIIARPDAAVLAASGEPDWPADVGDAVLVSTVRLPLGGAGGIPAYETLVFRVTGIKNAEVDFDTAELDGDRYDTAGDAFLGHNDLVARWARVPLHTTADALNQIR